MYWKYTRFEVRFFGVLLMLWETMERYEIVKDIGAGNFGVAKLARDKWKGDLFAIKFIERGQKVCLFYLLLGFLLIFFMLQIWNPTGSSFFLKKKIWVFVSVLMGA